MPKVRVLFKKEDVFGTDLRGWLGQVNRLGEGNIRWVGQGLNGGLLNRIGDVWIELGGLLAAGYVHGKQHYPWSMGHKTLGLDRPIPRTVAVEELGMFWRDRGLVELAKVATDLRPVAPDKPTGVVEAASEGIDNGQVRDGRQSVQENDRVRLVPQLVCRHPLPQAGGIPQVDLVELPEMDEQRPLSKRRSVLRTNGEAELRVDDEKGQVRKHRGAYFYDPAQTTGPFMYTAKFLNLGSGRLEMQD